MKISLIYHVNSNYETLPTSISAIFKQTCKDFEFVLVDDHSNKHVKEAIQKFDFTKLPKFTYINSNQKLGHSFSFNVGLENATGEYIYYLGSNITISKDFIKKVLKYIEDNKNPDLIVINARNKKDSTSVIKSYKTIDKDLFKVLKPTIKDKIVNTDFLRKNKIAFENFQYYPVMYIYKILNKLTSCISVHEKLAQFADNKKYSYNLYDTFEQADYLLKNIDRCNFLTTQENKDIYEFVIIYSILYSFMYKIDQTYWKNAKIKNSTQSINKALSYANEWLKANIPDWRKNPILLNNTLGLEKKIDEYLKNFKFKSVYIHKKIK